MESKFYIKKVRLYSCTKINIVNLSKIAYNHSNDMVQCKTDGIETPSKQTNCRKTASLHTAFRLS